MKTIADLIKQLEDLGTPEAIADFLLAEGCIQSSTVDVCGSCPVALFLQKNGYPQARTSDWWASPRPNCLTVQGTDITPNVRAFIRSHDKNAFPQLRKDGALIK